jgi:hypothetical protein
VTRRRRRPWIADHRIEALLGGAAMLAGALLLRDAYDGRGRPTPPLLRPFQFL